MNSASASGEDCYYFLYSSCAKGADCPYRHQPLCIKNESLCKDWERCQSCVNPSCSFRHSLYHLQKNRSTILCYWEQHGGCRKAHCPFKHVSASNQPTSATAGSIESHFTTKNTREIPPSISGQKPVEPLKASEKDTASANSFSKRSLSSNYTAESAQNSTLSQKTYSADPIQKKEVHTIESSKKFKASTQHSTSRENPQPPAKADFQIKSIAHIMREKREKQAAAKADAVSQPSPNPAASNIAPSKTVSAPEDNEVLPAAPSLDDLEKELEEMNRLLS